MPKKPDLSKYKSYGLLPFERNRFALTQGPVCLLNFFKISQNEIGSAWTLKKYNNLVIKLKSIVETNKWLMGSIDRTIDPKHNRLVLKTDPDPVDGHDFMDVEKFVFETKIDESLFDFSSEAEKSLNFAEKCKLLAPYKLKQAKDCLKDDKSNKLFSFVVFRDHENVESCKNLRVDRMKIDFLFFLYLGFESELPRCPDSGPQAKAESRFSCGRPLMIMMSINHIIADGRTTYNLWEMVSKDVKVRALNRESKEYNEEMYKQTNLCLKDGKDPVKKSPTLAILPWIIKSYKRTGQEKYRTKVYNFVFNKEEINRLKKFYEGTDPSSSARGEWVSTNDILTSWLFSKNPKADFVQFAVDVRQRLKGFDLDLAGNYIGIGMLRQKDHREPSDVRNWINQNLTKNISPNNPQGVQGPLPTFNDLKKYHGGVSTNWSTFYRSVRIDGLEHDFSTPWWDVNDIHKRVLGMNISMEDNIIIYKRNDEEVAGFIWTGSGRIDEEKLLSDPMVLRRIW